MTYHPSPARFARRPLPQGEKARTKPRFGEPTNTETDDGEEEEGERGPRGGARGAGREGSAQAGRARRRVRDDAVHHARRDGGRDRVPVPRLRRVHAQRRSEATAQG